MNNSLLVYNSYPKLNCYINSIIVPSYLRAKTQLINSTFAFENPMFRTEKYWKIMNTNSG